MAGNRFTKALNTSSLSGTSPPNAVLQTEFTPLWIEQNEHVVIPKHPGYGKQMDLGITRN